MASFARAAVLVALFCGLVASTSAARYFKYALSDMQCSGTKRYNITFNMVWTKERFGDTVPENAHISPLTALTHTNRYTPFAEWGMASPEVETVAESGNNKPLVAALRAKTGMVGNVAALSAPGPNKGMSSLVVTADSMKGYTHLSAITMLAPTPDWTAQENNIVLCFNGKWAKSGYGPLYGYDAGTEATPGTDQQPQQNIYRLQKPRYPRYQNQVVGWWTVTMM